MNSNRTGPAIWLSAAVLLISGCVLPLEAQQLAIPAPPRFCEDGEFALRFEASATVNVPEGKGTLLASALSVRHPVRFSISGIDGTIACQATLGLSYRGDSGGMSLRLEENRLRVGSVLTLPLSWKVDPYVAGSIETTPTESFLYRDGGRRRIAKFWDPVISTESAGATVVFVGERLDVAGRVGLALEQIRAAKHPERTDDRKTEGRVERYRSSTGIEVAGDIVWQIDSSGVLESRVALYGTFDDLTTWRVQSENRIRVSFAEVLAFTWEVNLTHDVVETLRTQLFSQMAIGVTAPL